MISQIVMPDLGATGGDVLFVSWLVEHGDRVQVGQPLFLVETDKATVEVEAFREGVVRELLVEVGDSVPLGGAVAVLADSMEEPLPVDLVEESPIEPEPLPASLPKTVSENEDGRILASPIARRMAEVEGINLLKVKGTGREGQILKRDVVKAMSLAKSAPGVEPSVRREPVTAMRRAVARLTRQSKQEIPHYYVDITVDMSAALVLHGEAGEWAKKNERVSPTITDICLLAAAKTLGSFPDLNASFMEEEILYYQSINIGLVVGLATGGMLVPVVRNADELNLYTLAAITHQLKEDAERGLIRESELRGGSISLSNLGMYGVDSFSAVINPPQAAMLALGAVRERPAVLEGAIVPRPMMKATLSADHRLVDGIVAAQFLAAWKALLEQPSSRTLRPPEEISG